MSFLSDYITTIKDWIDDYDPADSVITSWIRDAEERMNNELRVKEMIVREGAVFEDNCAVLPENWLEHVYVRVAGGRPFDFITNHDYFELNPQQLPTVLADPYGGNPYPAPGRKQCYTTIGRTLFLWPPIDPLLLTKIEVCYYRAISPLGDTADEIFDRYPSIYRHCTLAAGAPYLIEDDRVATWATLATKGLEAANAASHKARHSGSPIAPRIRGFG